MSETGEKLSELWATADGASIRQTRKWSDIELWWMGYTAPPMARSAEFCYSTISVSAQSQNCISTFESSIRIHKLR
jgi:hypothetical protein